VSAKLDTATIIACKCAPYMTTALYSLIPVEAPWLKTRNGTPTLAVTPGSVMLWNPAALDRWTPPQTAGVLLHENMHNMLGHAARGDALGIKPGSHEAYLWNLACDACINAMLRAMAQAAAAAMNTGALPDKAHVFTMPEDCIFPETLGQAENLIEEERYRLLLVKRDEEEKKRDEEKEQEIQSSEQEPGDQGDGAGDDDQGDDQDAGDGASADGEAEGDKQGPTVGHCGSCAGHANPDEPADVKDAAGKALGRSPAEIERIRRVTAQRVQQEAASGRGLVPGELERWAGSVLRPPEVDWRTQLARIVRAAVAYRPGAVDSGWLRPSRRQAGLGWGAGVPRLPSLRMPTPRVAVVVDTSGSMGTDELNAALVETRGVLMALGAEITICACDADVHGIKQVASIEEAAAMLAGGGGTDMRPSFAALAEAHPRPEVVIVCTDGLIGDGYPEVEPTWCRAVWVVIGQADLPCPWGDQIRVQSSSAAA
jgi:predicted metal-dependent peptidase